MRDLLEVLHNYNILGEVLSTTYGPLLEIIEFKPAPGTKLKTITTIKEDIRRELGVSSLHIEPSTDSNSLLFEYPKDTFDTIDFNEVLLSNKAKLAKEKYALPICVGATIKGEPLFQDLAKIPHLVVGGTTGSGKSVGLNTFILSLIASKKPSELKLVLIDPKKIEFTIYNDQKYLYCPVITETNEAVDILAHLAEQMDKRYEIFSENLCKNLKDYNEQASKPLPYIVCVIDEFADLMASDPKVEKDVMRLAQKARAAGIHLILATQRPSVDVVTGVLKANFPTRLAYKVASNADSRTILDEPGAENLIGRGDCLFLSSSGELLRLHGAYIDDNNIKEMLIPYKCQIKPLKLEKKDETSQTSSPKAEVKKEGILTRFAKFWSKLKQKDKELIIKGIKYIFTFIVSFVQNSSKKRK